MKTNKVLIGLFASIMALTAGTASAQFHEIGPANIGGHMSSLAIDLQDSTLSTVYAGAISGGLYVRTSNTEVLKNLYSDIEGTAQYDAMIENKESWHLVRYIDDYGREQTLPISAMMQVPDGTIYLGTGDNTYSLGTTYNKMSSKGRGIYRYIASERKFKMVPYSDPSSNNLFGAVRALDYIYRDNTLYVFAATNTGLFRWTITDPDDEEEWANSAACVMLGDIDQLIVLRNLNMAYFTIGNQLYKIGNLTVGSNQLNPVNVSNTNTAFGGTNTAIKLAASPTDSRYLYAMVINANGGMENVYLTTNGQSWSALATPSVTPFNYNNGTTCGAIAVDPSNPRRIILGGSTIWIGEGFLEGGTYQWTKNSYSEFELNAGDYMSGVFNSAIFVHSGIHQILPVYSTTPVFSTTTDTIYHTWFIATNAGVFSSSTNFLSFDNINRGLNSVQINDIAVTPDGSLISGANFNACPFIEGRLAHNGGTPIPAWYDDGTHGNTNHDANILWTGNGGKVAASAFQQINIQSHRNIFVSSANGNIGRSFADYLDYTNNQTWTHGSPFLTTEVMGGPTIGSLYLWETDNDTYMRDSIKVGLDLSGFYFNSNGDTMQINGNANMNIPAGSKAVFLSKNNSDYPFTYTFTKAQKAGDSLVVKNPIVSRLLIVAQINVTQTAVLYSWMANDFSKIYDSITDNNADLDPNVKTALKEKFMWWAPILSISRNPITNTTNLYPRDAVMSNDGRFAYISTYDDSLHRSQLYRISGFENVNFNQYPSDIRREINSASDTSDRKLRNTKFLRGGSDEWFNRPISSIAVDPRPGQDRIVLTFEDYSDSYANVAIIDNPSAADWYNNITPLPITNHVDLPAYSAIIEDSTGNIYVGTADGVWVYDGTAWRQYDEMRGLAVTSIVQQTKKLPVRRAVTHTGITENDYLFAKTKWPRAIYFGTYGRGIFIDKSFVTDTINEVSDSSDYTPVSIPTVASVGDNSVSVYPNPVMGEAHLALTAAETGMATLRIYDLNGRLVVDRKLGHVAEGGQTYTIGTEGMAKGMYLVNVIIGKHTAATKMLVR